MELGALVCTAASPRCADCPVAAALRLAGRRAPRGPQATPGAGPSATRARTGSAADACSRCCATAPVPSRRPTSTSVWADPAQLARALDGLVADGLVDPLPDGRYALPGTRRPAVPRDTGVRLCLRARCDNELVGAGDVHQPAGGHETA